MEEVGIIRRIIQDVLVPEMQGIKERLAAHDEKFIAIDRRFDQVDKRFDQIDKRLDQIDKRLDQMDERLDLIDARLDRVIGAIERIEARLSFSELDKRLVRLEILLERGAGGPKATAA